MSVRMQLGERLAGFTRWRLPTWAWAVASSVVCLLAAYGAVLGLVYAHAAIGLGILMIGLGAHRTAGPGAGRAFAVGAAALLPLFLLASWEAANVRVLGPTDMCGTGRYGSAARLSLFAGLVAGALGIVTQKFFQGPARGRSPVLQGLPVVACLLGLLVAKGTGAVEARSDVSGFRRALEVYAEIQPPPAPERCLLPGPGDWRSQREKECEQILLQDEAIYVARECSSKRLCRITLNLRDGVGLRRSSAPVPADEPIRVLRDPRFGLWAVEAAADAFRDRRTGIVAAAVVGERSVGQVVRSQAVSGAIAPSVASVALGAAGALLAVFGLLCARRARRRIARVRSATQAEIGEDGWVSVSGERVEARRLDPCAIGVSVGPVVVEIDSPPEGYREAAAPVMSILARGRKEDVVAALEMDARDVGAVVLAAALHLGLPLIGAAFAGRV